MSSLLDFENNYGENFSLDFCESMERYIEHGYRPGGFAESMLAGDMERALYAADSYNRRVFWYIARWIREYMPAGAWGSYQAVDNWVDNVDDCRSKWVVWARLGGEAAE